MSLIILSRGITGVGVAVLDGQETILGAINVAIPATLRKRAEIELRRVADNLQRQFRTQRLRNRDDNLRDGISIARLWHPSQSLGYAAGGLQKIVQNGTWKAHERSLVAHQ